MNTYSYAVYYINEFDLIPKDQVETFFIALILEIVPNIVISKIRHWDNIKTDEGSYVLHDDKETPDEIGIAHTFLLYYDTLEPNDLRALEVSGDIVRPKRGKIVHLQNYQPNTLHRVVYDPNSTTKQREVMKITGFDC